MKKDEFLDFSLPHELKCYLTGNNTNNNENPTLKVCLIGGMIYQSYCDKSLEIECTDDDYIHNVSLDEVFPICHPLSDLKKDEWIDKLNTFACELLDAAHVYDEKNIVGLNWMTQPFEIVMWLVKNHFNLMDESEPFIDVNTLEINPYK